MRLIASILVLSLVMIIIYGTGSIQGYIRDTKTIAGNTFSTASCWIQNNATGATGFTGTRSDTEINTVGIELRENGNHYRHPGNFTTPIKNTGIPGATLDMISWEKNTPAGTSITLLFRASNSQFSETGNTPAWQPVTGNSPATTGLPSGQYLQWRVVLTTNNNHLTPTLYSVEVWYH